MNALLGYSSSEALTSSFNGGSWVSLVIDPLCWVGSRLTISISGGAERRPLHAVVRRRRSVVNWLNTKSLKSFKAVRHGFERFRRVPLPIRDLARNP